MQRFWTIFDGVRRVVIFVLGSMILLDAITDKVDTIAKLVMGSVLVGILPLEEVLPWNRRSRSGRSANNE